MMTIYETEHFFVKVEEQPLVSRMDGGHISINPKIPVVDRSELSPKLAIELMYLSVLSGKAMMAGLNENGIDVARINYQDNGNWGVFKPEGPFLHLHLFGRAKSAKIQKYGEACYFPFRESGFYNGFEPLNLEDVYQIRKQFELLLTTEKYRRSFWGI